MATSAQIIAASSDADLQRRLRAMASAEGIPNAQSWVEGRLDELAAAPVNESGDTVGSVYEYAALTYKPTPRPGENPAAVTDEYLKHAIEHVKGQG